MTRLSMSEKSSKYDEKERSTLAAIRGIGAIKKQWLKALGIVTVQDLATAVAESIAADFKRKGRAISHQEIAAWIAQAQALVLESSAPCETAEDAKKTQLPGQDESLSAIAVAPATDLWQTIAAFKVEFQTLQGTAQPEQRTIVRHIETNAIATWSGIESEQIPHWLLDQLNTDKLLATKEPVALEITQLRMVPSHRNGVVMIANKTRRLFPGSIQTGEPFTLEASMCFSGQPTGVARKQLVYRAQCQAHNLSSGITTDLGDTIANVPIGNQASYTALFPDISLQQPGAYRLKVCITLQNAVAVPACFKVPMLQVR